MKQIHGPLRVSSSGEDVKTLQATLNQVVPAKPLYVDGRLGIRTEAAVREFQRANNLRCDGIVGPRTAAALGLRYVATAPVQSVSEIRRRHLGAFADPDELQEAERALAAAGVDEEAGIALAISAALISCHRTIYRRLHRMVKNTVGVPKEGQIRMSGLLASTYTHAISMLGSLGGAPASCGPLIAGSAACWPSALTGCAAELRASAAPVDQQLGAKFRVFSLRFGEAGYWTSNKAAMLLQGSGEPLDTALLGIMAKLLATLRW